MSINNLTAIEHENSYIWCIIMDNHIYEELNDKVFYDLDNREIFKAVKKVIDRWDTADIVSVWAELENTKKLIEIMDNPFSTLNSETYLKNIIEAFNGREVYNNLEHTKNALMSRQIDAITAVSEIGNMEIQNSFNSDYSINKVIADKLKEWKPKAYTTSLPTLDKNLSAWGIEKWRVLRVVAYSNTGKSRLSYQMTNHFLKQWAKVCYVSLEIDWPWVLCNVVSNYHGVKYQDVSDNFPQYATDIYNGKFSIVSKKFQLSQIFRAVKQINPDIVVLDYLQLVSIPWAKSIFEFTEEYSAQVQRFALEHGIMWVDLSQTSTDWFWFKKWDRAPAKWSWSLQATCDVMLMMHKQDDNLMITVAKNRYGKKDFSILIDADFSRSIMKDVWEDVPTDEPERELLSDIYI